MKKMTAMMKTKRVDHEIEKHEKDVVMKMKMKMKKKKKKEKEKKESLIVLKDWKFVCCDRWESVGLLSVFLPCPKSCEREIDLVATRPWSSFLRCEVDQKFRPERQQQQQHLSQTSFPPSRFQLLHKLSMMMSMNLQPMIEENRLRLRKDQEVVETFDWKRFQRPLS